VNGTAVVEPPAHLRLWAATDFAKELVPVCGPRHGCASPGKRPHAPGWETATFALSGVGDVVEVAQVTDVAGTCPTLTVFDPAELRGGEQKGGSDVVACHVPVQAKLAQQRP